jgi:hypothetical protein
MDDNLNIHINDYLENIVIKEKHPFEKEKLVQAIKQYSEKYTYDDVNELVKLKYRPKRRIIVFRDIPKENQKNEDIINLLKLYNQEKKHGEEEHVVVKIESSNELFFVYFKDEEATIEVFKWIEKMRDNEKVSNNIIILNII